MVKVVSGKDWEGKDCEFYLDENLKDNLDAVKKVVSNKNFDFVCVISGLPGLGKSNFAITMAKYCCEWFDKDYIVADVDNFIKLTTECKKYSAVILDESFFGLNTQVVRSPEFLKIINHLQLIRQKNLFIFLCLPNFFDLAKGIAVYRSHFLFVCYGTEFGDRGSFAAFDRNLKRELYIKGKKFMDYQCAIPNFRGKFVKQKVVDDDWYENVFKPSHLKEPEEQDKKIGLKHAFEQRDKLIIHNHIVLKMPIKELCDITGLKDKALYAILKKHKGEAK